MRRSIIFFFLMAQFATAQTFNWKNDTTNARLIGWCECMHGATTLWEAQQKFLIDAFAYKKIHTVFLELNDLYASESYVYKYIHSLDSTVKIVGYNPGNLYASFQWVKKQAKLSDSAFISELKQIFNKLDSSEYYYWYKLTTDQYNDLLQKLYTLKKNQTSELNRRCIRQLVYDLSYLKNRALVGDQCRDSLMFEFIRENLDSMNPKTSLVFGHCGHLSKQNPVLLHNLGFRLSHWLKSNYLLIGTSALAVKVVDVESKKFKVHKVGRKKILQNAPKDRYFKITENYNQLVTIFLVGADLYFGRDYSLNLFENFDWMIVFNEIKFEAIH